MERSDTTGAIGGALAKAQAQITPAAKDTTNPHFKSKYADLAAVWEACRVALTANEVAVVQSPEADGAKVVVTTLLLHSSGEWLQSALSLKARDDSPQAVGSAITYGRRYGLASMVGVAPDDDDGNAAQPTRETRREAQPARPAPSVINDEQRNAFWAKAKEVGWSRDDVTTLLQKYDFQSSRDITADKYAAILQDLETGVVAHG